ncbi:MAG: hypothetical protein HN778_05550 [Prolixibacteraceae bacterium]|jgi:hypothetical protein|nr:hypothetical protein [Prolixibacteraceae bacterium]MBT6007521.1 hypothetical protein [Prolixibacteraceae bacterium]MBT6766541.1 hypothetical protein [Prolixibacteraceae bacterium]MBT6999807.1 hypothetical protein [Prolixibacteraceae bacterium]MBT7394282.1 hypothetical protein [Prolixibacteraceae bacterium]
MKTKINQLMVSAIFALIMLVGNVSAKGTEISALSLEIIEEPALEMEDWMVNENCWEAAENTFYFFDIEDEKLTLESWMVDTKTWIINSIEYLKTETENELLFESWMINKSVWKR